MKYLLILLLCSIFSFGESATKDDIKLLVELIKNNQEQTNKRFEQIDKRFEQIDRRFDFMQKLMYLLMGLVFASPFIAIHISTLNPHNR